MPEICRLHTTMSADDSGQLADVLSQRTDEVRDILSGIPGFVSYDAIGTGETVVSVSVYQDHAGAMESTRRASEWVRQNLPGATIGSPEVTEGETFLKF